MEASLWESSGNVLHSVQYSFTQCKADKDGECFWEAEVRNGRQQHIVQTPTLHSYQIIRRHTSFCQKCQIKFEIIWIEK